MTLGQNSPGRDLKDRYLVLGGLMLLGMLVLAVRTYRLQVTRYDEFTMKSAQNFIREVRLRADRGMIVDRAGEILADNRPSFDLFLTPAFCQHCEKEVLPRLVSLLRWDPALLPQLTEQYRNQRRAGPFQPTRLKIDLSREEVEVINAHHTELSGVEVEPVAHREYRPAPPYQVEGVEAPPSTYLPHVLGYMNEITQQELDRRVARGDTAYRLGDYIGRRGLERFYEVQLRGKDGVRKEVVNARGETLTELNRLLGEHERTVEPKPGHNLQLSIDLRLEDEAERVFPGRAGAVVMVEVNTGFIITMLSRPGYDANMMTGRVSPTEMAQLFKDPLQPMVFRPVAQHYAPGSTFKVVTALAALRSGLFSPHTAVSCPGGYRLGSRFWRCHLDRGHGVVQARSALKESCDTYYFTVADRLGLDPIARVGAELGLGQRTGIGVVAEVPGIMPSEAYHHRVTPGGYHKGMALNSAIGQGDDNTTPLQLAMMYAAIANGGTLYQPQLVKRVFGADGETVEELQPKVVRKVEIKPEHRQVLVDALVAVVNEPGGTAYRSRLPDITVAGKTGTAQVVALGKVRLKTHQMDYFERDHAWFAAFAPADNPEVAVVVLNEHGGHGGADAAPTASALIKKYFELKNADLVASGQPPIPPDALRRPAPKALPAAPPLPAPEAAPAEAAGTAEVPEVPPAAPAAPAAEPAELAGPPDPAELDEPAEPDEPEAP